MSELATHQPVESLLQQYRTLLNVADAIIAHRDLAGLFRELAQSLQLVVHFDAINLILYDERRQVMRLHVKESPEADELPPCLELPVDESPGGWAWKHQQPLLLPSVQEETRWPKVLAGLRHAGVRSACALPLTTAQRRVGAIAFASMRPSAYGDGDLDFLVQVAKQVAVAVDNALVFQEIAELKNRLTVEKLYLEDEIRTEHNFEDIVGESPALKRILKEVAVVAPTDSTVLLQGETGTGKEVIARAIHNLSRRKERTFVKLNCAAIPTGLLEGELFGHEKGAFTGAVARKVGRFELAHEGTLFLDEIGDIQPEVQPKLLRVLQEQEFERLGSTKTQRVDVRLIAATNRDLAQMVAAREFRGDLYYRLNVFPITLPPLRDRREDIPPLVRHLTHKCAGRIGKRIETIPAEALAALCQYSWPGNIRELENLVERAVILSPGPELRVPVEALPAQGLGVEPARNGFPTLADTERETILGALREANWVVGGLAGAAARLGLNRTTLQSKMRKLGISRPR